MLLEIKDLIVHYAKVAAIRGVSLKVQKGEMVCLIGSNGAGKTTILRTISGLKRPTSGEILFKNLRIDGIPSQDIVKLGIAHVPEGRRLFPALTVHENLLLGAYLMKDRKSLNRNLELVYSHFPVLRERSKQQAGKLSGGEQQMLAMGRALMFTPNLMLLDEPSLGLSPVMVQEVAKIVKNINQEGITTILIEQNAFLALQISRRGYVLETGSIVLEGDSDKLMTDEHVKKAYLGV